MLAFYASNFLKKIKSNEATHIANPQRRRQKREVRIMVVCHLPIKSVCFAHKNGENKYKSELEMSLPIDILSTQESNLETKTQNSWFIFQMSVGHQRELKSKPRSAFPQKDHHDDTRPASFMTTTVTKQILLHSAQL